ncbi:MAG: lyase family protein [Patescibacteria group bacterium]|nr:lyase family protein [Patescibacteria group bacterium]
MQKYFGEETKKALRNFPFSTHPVKMEFILALVKIKKAAAIANFKSGGITQPTKNAIVRAADEILSGKLTGQFPLSSFQGGAGTAINMNVNEVLAGRATEILGGKTLVHPNDHINRSQSTNDVNPSAIKVASSSLLLELDSALAGLIKTFEAKAKTFSKVIKLGRTHMQDAVPTTLGAEFSAYAENLKSHRKNLEQASNSVLTLNLGGTAIGNSVNASPKYIQEVYRELNKITKAKFTPAKNLMSKTGSHADFVVISQAVVALCVELSKIANDFKFMSSGPRGGIGEIVLSELQKGSSIMPGKVNPVMPETLNQLYFLVSGNNLTIEKAAEASQMELGVMLPVIADRLLESIQLSAQTIKQFDQLCVAKVKADAKKCREYLENSTAFATFLAPEYGYDTVSQMVKACVKSGASFKAELLQSGLMKEKDWNAFTKGVIKKLA